MTVPLLAVPYLGFRIVPHISSVHNFYKRSGNVLTKLRRARPNLRRGLVLEGTLLAVYNPRIKSLPHPGPAPME
jgi:hypothetical protein